MDDLSDTATLLPNEEEHFLSSNSQLKHQYGTFKSLVLEGRNQSLNVSTTAPSCKSITEQQSCSVSLDVVDLSYKIKERSGQWWNGSCFKSTKEMTVLYNLNMTFKKGEITALVGSSGSGKTSLLDVISGRVHGEVTGEVNYKHNKCTKAVMKQISSYVLQADRLLPTLTVTETLTYMAYLKLPGYLDSSDIDAKVQSVITEMGLRHVAETRIGGTVIRGVSGGEKRRITIGVQLLRDPEILLLDEPTSGLDAFTARQLVSCLADLAHKGKIIIMSIHQPRSDIFALLDKVAILTVGRLAFCGRSDELVPYFTSIGHPCPGDQNPCDVYIDITSVDRRNPVREKSTQRIVQSLCTEFANSEIQTSIVKNITRCLDVNDSFLLNGQKRSEVPSWSRQFQCVLNRMNVHLWRDRGAFLGRFMFLPFFVPFIMIFLGRLSTSQESIQNRLGLIYQSTQVPAYVGVTNCIALFPVLREVFYRESQDGLYSTYTFLFAYFVHCLPFNVITAGVFCTALYWIAGLNNDIVAFGAFILVCVILVQFGEMMAASILGIIINVQLANNTTALVFSASGLLASGLLRAVANMPKLLQWAGYIAIHKYATEIIVANEFHGLEFQCDPSGEGNQCLKTGDDYLHMFYTGAIANTTRNFILLGSYSVAIYILAVIMFSVRGTPTLH